MILLNGSEKMGKLNGQSIAIVTAHEFEDVELLYPLLRLSEEGASITVATLPKDASAHFHPRSYHAEKPITGRFGSTVPFMVLEGNVRWTHKQIPELDPSRFDAVIVPGGFAPDYLRIDHTTLAFIAGAHRAGKVVSAICHGPQVLISVDAVEGTDIVKGRDVTCYAAVTDDIRNAGGIWHDCPAVTSGNVITGRCPDDLPEYCAAIIARLSGEATDGPSSTLGNRKQS